MKTPPKTLKEAKSLKELPEGLDYALIYNEKAIMGFFTGGDRWFVVKGEDNIYYKAR